MEMWLPVVGYEGHYEVSDHGRVRSLDRILLCKNRFGGIDKRAVKGRVLRPGPLNRFGHLSVALGRTNHGQRGGSKLVHLLVLEAFVGPRLPGMEGAHKDGNAGNNKLENIRYTNRSDNNYDCSRRDGFRIKRNTVAAILANPHISAKKLAKRLEVSATYVWKVRHGELRLHG